MARTKSRFVCQECGYVASSWLGRCPECGGWNTLVEEAEVTAKASKSYLPANNEKLRPRTIASVAQTKVERLATGIREFDRVLGGGVVPGSLVLLGGTPGIGKSTILLDAGLRFGQQGIKVLYVSGEESEEQTAMRAVRLGGAQANDNLLILTATDLDAILAQANALKPQLLIIDSIQTMYNPELQTAAGSVGQVRECTAKLLQFAKSTGIAVLLIGHVTKDGTIAGPRLLEHMVDAVLYFEGDKQHIFRIIRAAKNRFGSTNEIGVFEMLDDGLREVENPSELLMTQRQTDVSGSCAVCVIEGSRPIIAEIQALASPTVYPSPRRMSAGIDYNRLSLLLAVLEKRLGLKFSTRDVYLSVAGGLRLDEPSADMSSALALISTLRDLPVREDLIAFGEIGLSGECRAVTGIDIRIHESRRLGFKRIAIPYRALNKLKANTDGVEIIPIRSVFDLLKLLG